MKNLAEQLFLAENLSALLVLAKNLVEQEFTAENLSAQLFLVKNKILMSLQPSPLAPCEFFALLNSQNWA